ncbi:MAG TPA: carbon-nitrogen hydrolase [Candidatus Thermoplasmatota archaeon]|nr:carbon-nitrogen hydrolase [Candidatus Thermoplasmatota archaeon]
MSPTVRVALLQTHASADPEDNLRRTLALAREAAARGAKIVCLQELYRTEYFPREESQANFRLAETIPGPSTEAFSALARETGVVLVVPIFEKRAAGLYHNSLAVIDADGRLVGVYRKMHIPDDPCFFEKFYFAPGDTGFCAFDTRYGRVAALICWDQWYPEGARLAALAGAQFLFYPTAIGYHPNDAGVAHVQRDAWETIQRSHAIANGVFVGAANRVGREDEVVFWGASFVAGPFGEVLARASQDKEEILLADCDLSQIESARHGWPFLRDRRIDAYDGLTKRFLDAA